MKKLKKKQAILLAVLLVFVVISCVIYRGALSGTKSAVVSLSSATGKQGDEVVVNLNLSNNPGIVALSTKIEYDTDVLELVNVTGTDNIFPTETLMTSENISDIPYVMMWEDGLNSNKNTNGTLAQLTFKIKEKTSVGKYEIRISRGDFYDFELNQLSVTAKGGTIYVK